nr:hypothetical protein [Tanacetum cinerariifolium]
MNQFLINGLINTEKISPLRPREGVGTNGVEECLIKVLVSKELPINEDIIAEFCSPSRWKELSKETSSKILPCGDGSNWKTFKPFASLVAKGKLKLTQARSFPVFIVKV